MVHSWNVLSSIPVPKTSSPTTFACLKCSSMCLAAVCCQLLQEKDVYPWKLTPGTPKKSDLSVKNGDTWWFLKVWKMIFLFEIRWIQRFKGCNTGNILRYKHLRHLFPSISNQTKCSRSSWWLSHSVENYDANCIISLPKKGWDKKKKPPTWDNLGKFPKSSVLCWKTHQNPMGSPPSIKWLISFPSVGIPTKPIMSSKQTA